MVHYELFATLCLCVRVSQPLIDGDLLGKTKHRTLKAITSLGE